jgi:hypothetical protein
VLNSIFEFAARQAKHGALIGKRNMEAACSSEESLKFSGTTPSHMNTAVANCVQLGKKLAEMHAGSSALLVDILT